MPTEAAKHCQTFECENCAISNSHGGTSGTLTILKEHVKIKLKKFQRRSAAVSVYETFKNPILLKIQYCVNTLKILCAFCS